jgi:hypothetical protein
MFASPHLTTDSQQLLCHHRRCTRSSAGGNRQQGHGCHNKAIFTFPQPLYATVARISATAAGDRDSETFSDIFSTHWSQQPPTHSVRHSIKTAGCPIAAKFSRLDPIHLAAAKAEFKQMLDAGIVRWYKSPWSSPLHMDKKKDGTWRPCHLNNITTTNSYPLLNIVECAAHRAADGCRVFSKLDLYKGYLQVPVATSDQRVLLYGGKSLCCSCWNLYHIQNLPRQ